MRRARDPLPRAPSLRWPPRGLRDTIAALITTRLAAMTHSPLAWIGLAGIAPDDNPRAQHWQKRLHGVMVTIALLAVPAYVFETADVYPTLKHLANVLDTVIFVAFLLEAIWMAHVSSHPVRYLFENWLNLIILIGAL